MFREALVLGNWASGVRASRYLRCLQAISETVGAITLASLVSYRQGFVFSTLPHLYDAH